MIHFAARLQQAVDQALQTSKRSVSDLRTVVLTVIVFGGIYGWIMGSYSWIVAGNNFGQCWPQMVYSAAKVPLLLFATFALTLPSFYVFNSLLGLRNDFAHVTRLIIVSQSTLAVVLCSLAPFVAFWYVSITDNNFAYSASILLNTVFFGGASLVAQFSLRRDYRSLIARQSRHRWMLVTWLALFGLVGIQMGWVLRPFIGNPDQDPAFLRPEAWDNAFLKLWEIVCRVF